MSSEPAIDVRTVSKCYHVYQQPVDRLKQSLFRGRRRYYREFWAVRDVTFHIERGQTVGIIGRNGAGKSTLLQMICGTLAPSSGSIQVHGRVAALLELGAGFNPEFTGRENAQLSAALYGLDSREIQARLEDILAFADIGDYVDQPVKTYSSGMYVRLAFAVIAHVSADILIIDEALSVGDVFFQQKCMRFLTEFKQVGGTLLFVSHDMTAVSALCDSAVLLRRQGSQYLCDTGSAKTIARLYLRELYDDKANSAATTLPTSSIPTHMGPPQAAPSHSHSVEHVAPASYHVTSFRQEADSFGTGNGSIQDVFFQTPDGLRISQFESGERVELVVRAQAHKSMVYPAIGFMLKDRKGQYIVAESTDSYLREHELVLPEAAMLEARFAMRMPALIRGEYTLDVAFAEGPGDDHIQHHWIHDIISLTALNQNLVQGYLGATDLSITFSIE